ncbi:MAG: hypothetical protein V1831_03690 [Candidatus Woesearchaeota archaeon]
MVISNTTCPRDGGKLSIEKDQYGSYRECINCGYTEEIEQKKNNVTRSLLEFKILDTLSTHFPQELDFIRKGVSQPEKEVRNSLQRLSTFCYISSNRDQYVRAYSIESKGETVLQEYRSLIREIKESSLEIDSDEIADENGKLTEFGKMAVESEALLLFLGEYYGIRVPGN